MTARYDEACEHYESLVPEVDPATVNAPHGFMRCYVHADRGNV
jgi:hypothetical protein